ncbi:polyprenyl synthetase family protein [Microbacterium sp. JZ31]|uniref:polyprenyl synthetase family protein n=1 Tax=Microbacterium sp. JZ31 TaxID=1906274 RepID=UPI0019315A13|nr:polyprenyl synthetase family protein [Microbacterium sp. JZ31]
MTPSLPLIEAISQRLDKFTAERKDEAAEFGDEGLAFVSDAASSLQGGKRLRARFAWWGWRGIASDADADADAVIDACAALEIFQAAALVHDDLIDNSDTRRGRPSAHRALETRHREAGWTGDAESFGRAGSVLLGDLLVAWSDDLFEDALAALSSPVAAIAARAEYARMRRDVTVGQFLDIAEESAWSTAPEDAHAERALRIASYKSARYSVQQPLVIGGALASGDGSRLRALRAFGHPLGMAFQLRDDVLGVFGDAHETGKPAGDDLREGKRTALVAFTRAAASGADRARFDAALGDPAMSDQDVAWLRDLIASSGALARVEQLISDYAAQADDALASAGLQPEAARELHALARAAVERRA